MFLTKYRPPNCLSILCLIAAFGTTNISASEQGLNSDRECDRETLCQLELPDRPANIAKTTSTVANANYAISWSSVTGDFITYRLDERKDGGNWGQIYSGNLTKMDILGRAAGKYGYRVKACGLGECSNYTTLSPEVTHGGEVRYTTYNQLKQEFPNLAKGGESQHWIGDGIDVLSGSLRDNCYNDTNFPIKYRNLHEVPPGGATYSYVRSQKDLQTSYELNHSSSVSIFEITGSNKVNFVSKSHFKNDRTYISAQYVWKEKVFEFADLNTEVNASKKAHLSSGNKMGFRNSCGDKYLQSATIGGSLSIRVSVNDTYTKLENKLSIASSLGAKLKLLSTTNDNTVKTSIINELKTWDTQIECVQDGGGANVCVGITDDNFKQRIESFGQSMTVKDNWVIIDSKYADYKIPSGFSSTNRDDYFFKYSNHLNSLNNWESLKTQLNNRGSRFPLMKDGCDFVINNYVDQYAKFCQSGDTVAQCSNPLPLADNWSNYCPVDFGEEKNDDIGVIADGANCPNGYVEADIYMDDENHRNINKIEGWSGSITQSSKSGGWFGGSSNTTLRFCRVDGKYFKPLAEFGQSTQNKEYAVIKLDENCPNGSEEFVRHFDNQDGGWTSATKFISPSNITSAKNTNLHFCLFRSGKFPASSTMNSFPKIGFGYGVFSKDLLSNLWSASGSVLTDDEDSDNRNRIYSTNLNSQVTASAKVIIEGTGNTKMYLKKVQ